MPKINQKQNEAVESTAEQQSSDQKQEVTSDVIILNEDPSFCEMATRLLDEAERKSLPLLKTIDQYLALTDEKETRTEIAHRLLREINGYLAEDRGEGLVYCNAYRHIKKNYADAEFVAKIELSCTYTIWPDKAKIFSEILKSHPNLLPQEPITNTVEENTHKTDQKNIPTDEKTSKSKLTSKLNVITGLPEVCITETLFFLPYNHPLFTNDEGLDFFNQHDLFFRIKLRDEFGVDWDLCRRTFGPKNMCSLALAYRHLVYCFDTPGWDFEYRGDPSAGAVSVLHPYLPACVLKQIPSDSSHLNNLFRAWLPDTVETKLTSERCRYAMRLACSTGNVELVQALVINAKPEKDNLHRAIMIKCLLLVKYILENNNFGVTASIDTFFLAVDGGAIAIVQYLLTTIDKQYQQEVRNKTLEYAKLQQIKLTKTLDQKPVENEDLDGMQELMIDIQKTIQYLSSEIQQHAGAQQQTDIQNSATTPKIA